MNQVDDVSDKYGRWALALLDSTRVFQKRDIFLQWKATRIRKAFIQFPLIEHFPSLENELVLEK